jgi:hypothetical protein
MVLKAALFLVLVLACAFGLWLPDRQLRTALLLVVLAWSAARLYYFLFYVLHTYVDPTLKYSGLLALLRQLAFRRRS